MKKDLKENDFLNMSFNKSAEEIKKEILEPKTKENQKKYNLMLSINPVLLDFFKESKFFTQMNYKDYVNHLIRKDMIERVGASKDCTDEELINKWIEYRKKVQEMFRQASL
jgi:predicted glycosyl hydrolase (DUF1957 family)